MNVTRNIGALAATAFVAVAGMQLSSHTPAVFATPSAEIQNPEQIRLSAAISFADKAKRYLSRSIVFDRWSQALTNGDGSTVCLVYAGTPNQPGVAILSGSRVSQNPEDWPLKCADKMFDLTAELNQR